MREEEETEVEGRGGLCAKEKKARRKTVEEEECSTWRH